MGHGIEPGMVMVRLAFDEENEEEEEETSIILYCN
jgi:hypothetical protein